MSDLIDRQAAIATAISGRVRTLPTTENGENWIRVSEVRDNLLSLPSTQPEILRCKDCANWDTSWETDAGNHFCSMVDSCTTADFYCAYAESRTDG